MCLISHVKTLFRFGITVALCKKQYFAEIEAIDHTKDLNKIVEINKKIENLESGNEKAECESSRSLLEGVYYVDHDGPDKPVGVQICGDLGYRDAHGYRSRGVIASPGRTYYAYCAKETENRIKRKEDLKKAAKAKVTHPSMSCNYLTFHHSIPLLLNIIDANIL